MRGNLVYAYAAIRALIAWRPATFTISLDDAEPIENEGYSVAAANSRAFGGGMFVAPHAELDDGMLDVITVSDVSKLRYARGLPKAFKGTHLDNDEVSELRGANGRDPARTAPSPSTPTASTSPTSRPPSPSCLARCG